MRTHTDTHRQRVLSKQQCDSSRQRGWRWTDGGQQWRTLVWTRRPGDVTSSAVTLCVSSPPDTCCCRPAEPNTVTPAVGLSNPRPAESSALFIAARGRRQQSTNTLSLYLSQFFQVSVLFFIISCLFNT